MNYIYVLACHIIIVSMSHNIVNISPIIVSMSHIIISMSHIIVSMSHSTNISMCEYCTLYFSCRLACLGDEETDKTLYQCTMYLYTLNDGFDITKWFLQCNTTQV